MLLARHLLAATLVLATGCSTTAEDPPEPVSAEPSATSTPTPSPVSDMVGDFPAFPRGGLPQSTARALQAALRHGVLVRPEIRGATASVIVMGEGSWSGAVGRGARGQAFTPTSRQLTASIGKTITTAAILRLVDEGRIGLDDRATDHLPPELASFDLNDARIRDLLGMRGGFGEPDRYWELQGKGVSVERLLSGLPAPHSAAGETTQYTNVYFVILAAIVEHITGKPFADAVSDGVMSDASLSGFRFPRRSALAGDGEQVEVDSATLARWGYELYGGHIVSEAMVREMADFKGEWYGLGTIDMSGDDDFGIPALGHGGGDVSIASRLVILPEAGIVVAIQANPDNLDPVFAIVPELVAAVTR
jgi:CubicO group peptidase (beta-lactamase class C family)